jgi:hypothetical protein
MNDSFESNVNFLSNRHQRLQLSKHAKKRGQQRGSKEIQIPLIQAFGEKQFDGRGAIRYTMTKNAMRNLYRACGFGKIFEALEGLYIVVSVDTDTVITIAHLQN